MDRAITQINGNIDNKMQTKFTCILNSNREKLAKDLIALTPPEIGIKWINQGNCKSYSSMVNNAIKTCQTEMCIIMSDKARPSLRSYYKTIQLLRLGYGLVGLYGLGFFGIHLETIRKIGFFDENFLNGGQEDIDFLIRLIEGDIAYYYDLEIPYMQMHSSWPDSTDNRRILSEKWEIKPSFDNWPKPEFFQFKRLLPDGSPYNGEFGYTNGFEFLDNSYTIHHR